jgi:predicted RNA-binding Zn-ribbon protein involved in translation (DUF1610 family)
MHNQSLKNPRFDEVDNINFEKFTRKQKNFQAGSKDRSRGNRFRCANCGSLVIANRELSGVNNRNHCPNCLWSKHVDEFKAGDRKASCCSRMQPIGLTVKQIHKKYTNQEKGELMLIHRCTGCGKISINRIASDDSTGALITLYEQADEFSVELRVELAAQKIYPLLSGDITTVFSQLFGWQSILDEFEGDHLCKEISVGEDVSEITK